MKRGEYYRGRNGRKYGIWNTVERGTDTKYEGYSYFLVMEKDL